MWLAWRPHWENRITDLKKKRSDLADEMNRIWWHIVMQLSVKYDSGTLFCFLSFARGCMAQSCSQAFREQVIKPEKTMNAALRVYLSVTSKELSGYIQ